MRKTTIPKKFKHLFWEYDLDKIDLDEHRYEIVERITSRGDFQELFWMFEQYSKDEIIDVLKNNYNVSNKAVEIWSTILNFDKSTCKCTQRPSQLSVFDF